MEQNTTTPGGVGIAHATPVETPVKVTAAAQGRSHGSSAAEIAADRTVLELESRIGVAKVRALIDSGELVVRRNAVGRGYVTGEAFQRAVNQFGSKHDDDHAK